MQRADKNNMKVNLSKAWESLLKSRTSQLPPIPLTMHGRTKTKNEAKVLVLGGRMPWIERDGEWEFERLPLEWGKSGPPFTGINPDQNWIECPTNWDTQIDNVLKKAGSRRYILRVCKYYGYSTKHLDLQFSPVYFLLGY